MPIHDLRCVRCEEIEENVSVYRENYPKCPSCGGKRTWVPAKMTTDSWGGPRWVNGIDRYFDSRSDLKSYLKRNGVLEAGDAVGGARNNDGMKRSHFSYANQKKRS
jgi:DNA-directed RNA polymerase subunit RPC12/RpoP